MLLEFAKSMRGKPTDAEHRLWQQLRAGRLQHYKFKRQQPMEKYIADFVCFEARLVVELDGGQHNGSSSDVVRDDWLKAQGFIVLRFWNNEVFENLAGVMERILAQLLALPPSLHPLSNLSPVQGERLPNADIVVLKYYLTSQTGTAHHLPPRRERDRGRG